MKGTGNKENNQELHRDSSHLNNDSNDENSDSFNERMRDKEGEQKKMEELADLSKKALFIKESDVKIIGKKSSVVSAEDADIPVGFRDKIKSKTKSALKEVKTNIGAELHSERHQQKTVSRIDLGMDSLKNFGIAFLKAAKPIPGLSLVAKLLRAKIGPNKFDIDDKETWNMPLSHTDRCIMVFNESIAPLILAGFSYWSALTVSLMIPVLGPIIGIATFIFCFNSVYSAISGTFTLAKRLKHDIKTFGFSKGTSRGESEDIIKTTFRAVGPNEVFKLANKGKIGFAIKEQMKFDLRQDRGVREFGSIAGNALKSIQKCKTVSEFLRAADKHKLIDEKDMQAIKEKQERDNITKVEDMPEIKVISDALIEYIVSGPTAILLGQQKSSDDVSSDLRKTSRGVNRVEGLNDKGNNINEFTKIPPSVRAVQDKLSEKQIADPTPATDDSKDKEIRR